MSESVAARVSKKRPNALEQFSPEEIEQLYYHWIAWARPEQLPPPGDWRTWIILAGRGFGKTRAGAEWVRSLVESGQAKRFAFIAPTAADVRDVMVEGESGILATSPPWNKPIYEPSKRRITWPNGAIATMFSAEEPDRLRGPQHDALWADELCAWQYADDVWNMAQFGLRLGRDPRCLVTTTPKSTPLLRQLVRASDTVITRGTTFDNAANLAKPALDALRSRYEGTRLGRQEMMGELLEDPDGALWHRDLIDAKRLRSSSGAYSRVVVAVDPSGSAKKTADEAGIVVAAIADCNCNGRSEVHGFVLEDISGKLSPRDVGNKAIAAYHRHRANRLVAEDNFGGQIVADLIALIDSSVAYKAVRATKGKIIRAEPVAALYEQGKVHHVGSFPRLEDELCLYTPLEAGNWSPGRMDALVWALTDLMLGEPPASFGKTQFTGPSFHFGESGSALGQWDDD